MNHSIGQNLRTTKNGKEFPHLFHNCGKACSRFAGGANCRAFGQLRAMNEETVSVLGKLSLTQGQTFERKIWMVCKQMIPNRLSDVTGPDLGPSRVREGPSKNTKL